MYLLFYNVDNELSWDGYRFHDYDTSKREVCKQILKELLEAGDNVRWRIYNMNGDDTEGFCVGGRILDEDNFVADYNAEELDGGWYVRNLTYNGDLSLPLYMLEVDMLESEPQFKVGDFVRWNDPDLDDYDESEREEALNREFEVVEVYEETLLISDGFTEAEVYPCELEGISSRAKKCE